VFAHAAYHGTVHKFDKFSARACNGVFYFSCERDYAEDRALRRAGFYWRRRTKDVLVPYLVTAEISYSRPFRAPLKKLTDAELMDCIGATNHVYSDSRDARPVKGYFWSYLRWQPEMVVDILRVRGFDSIIMKEGASFNARPIYHVVSVFSAKQIKILSFDEVALPERESEAGDSALV